MTSMTSCALPAFDHRRRCRGAPGSASVAPGRKLAGRHDALDVGVGLVDGREVRLHGIGRLRARRLGLDRCQLARQFGDLLFEGCGPCRYPVSHRLLDAVGHSFLGEVAQVDLDVVTRSRRGGGSGLAGIGCSRRLDGAERGLCGCKPFLQRLLVGAGGLSSGRGWCEHRPWPAARAWPGRPRSVRGSGRPPARLPPSEWGRPGQVGGWSARSRRAWPGSRHPQGVTQGVSPTGNDSMVVICSSVSSPSTAWARRISLCVCVVMVSPPLVAGPR